MRLVPLQRCPVVKAMPSAARFRGPVEIGIGEDEETVFAAQLQGERLGVIPGQFLGQRVAHRHGAGKTDGANGRMNAKLATDVSPTLHDLKNPRRQGGLHGPAVGGADVRGERGWLEEDGIARQQVGHGRAVPEVDGEIVGGDDGGRAARTVANQGRMRAIRDRLIGGETIRIGEGEVELGDDGADFQPGLAEGVCPFPEAINWARGFLAGLDLGARLAQSFLALVEVSSRQAGRPFGRFPRRHSPSPAVTSGNSGWKSPGLRLRQTNGCEDILL